jgi:hypothetical protein
MPTKKIIVLRYLIGEDSQESLATKVCVVFG